MGTTRFFSPASEKRGRFELYWVRATPNGGRPLRNSFNGRRRNKAESLR
jgi:hypothetical protein